MISTAFGVTQVALAVALFNDMVWLSVLLVPIAGHLMHGHLVAFHETSHGLLGRNRLLNEISGVFLGVFSFMSFSLYRAAHQTHNVHLATERDEELWPFVGPGTSRRARIAAAILELTVGLLFTPFLFLRSFLREGSPIRNTRVRRRIWADLVLMTVVSTAVVTVANSNLWKLLRTDLSRARDHCRGRPGLAQVRRARRAHRMHGEPLNASWWTTGAAGLSRSRCSTSRITACTIIRQG